MRNITLILILLCFNAWCTAQEVPLYFRNYQVNNGLSSNTITCIIQDHKGFMWFGTRNGLNRFDGTSFRNFKKNISDSKSLGNNSILSLYEDEQQKLWVGTYRGIYLYDQSAEVFTFFNMLPAEEIRYIKEDRQHNIWIIANLKLYRYNEKTKNIVVYPFKNAEATCISISENGAVWVATSTGILKCYQPGTGTFKDFFLPEKLEKQGFNQIQDIYVVKDSALLIGTMNHAWWFNTHTLKVNNVFDKNPTIRNVQIHKIIKQSDEEYWFGTETGLYVFYPSTGSVNHIQKQSDDPYSITDNVIYAFCKDNEGGTWIGTFFGGINYYSKQYNRFRKYFPQSGINNLSGNLVHEICSDNFGNIWIGTEDAGLNKLNKTTGVITHYLPGQGQGSISYGNIHGLIADGNELWIGTYEHGLDVMDIRTGKVIRHYNAGNREKDIKGNFIVCLYKTRQGDILAGTWNGLFRYRRSQDAFEPLSFFNSQIQAITEDEAGTIWTCSYGNGVSYYNPKTNKGGHLISDADNSNSLMSNYVNNLYEDKNHNMWFCMEGGLTKLEPSTGKITRYSTSDGLPDDQIFRILEDDQGKFWISTAKGLAIFDPNLRNIKLFTTAYGLLSDQFNYNSAFKDRDGTLYFGSVKGMVSFKPSEFGSNNFVPPVFITGLQIDGKEVAINDESSPLKKSITYTSGITLPYNQSNISLDIAALSYVFPQVNQYQYKMEGLDKDWTILKSNRRIYYSNLPPGTYTFKVKGSSGGEAWNQKETRLSITVLPPVWARWWAYIFYSIIFMAVVITIFRNYHLALKEKNKRKIEILEIEKEREIYNAKIEFFTNIAHEIRTPLTLIKMPLDRLIRNGIHNKNDVQESLNMMNKNTHRLIDLTNQLLDFRKAEANKISLNFTRNDINELIKDTFKEFKEAAEQKQLQYTVSLPRMGLQAYVDTEAFRKILSNLLSNAIKYAEGNVQVRLLPYGSEDTIFHIEIKNDGFIIPYDLREKIFEPFFRIRETEKQAGTGIGLPLARSLAELHKGVLELKQPEGGQNIFFLTLPIHQETEISFAEESGEESMQINQAAEQESIDHSKPFILLVEDNKEILNFLGKELRHHYNTLRAYNGQEALEILQKENVSLVISDIMMPVMDGIELCRHLKSNLEYSHIPIILLTARNSLTSKIEGLEVGADAYIEKPFAFEHLHAQITNLLHNRNIIKEYFARSPLTHIKGIACSKADKNFLEELNAIIYEHITDMDLDVDRLSRLMNMSRPTLYRKIKGLSDLTPNELINLTRLKRAAELLKEGNYKINEVANMVGYTLQSNFSRDFHKQFGVTPSSFIHSD